MARTNPIYDRIDNNYNSNENNQNTSTSVNCSGTGNFWIIPEEYHVIKYVTISGKTKLKKAGGLPFGKFFWRKNIEIIDTRDKLINMEKKDYISSDGLKVSTDLFFQYNITDVRKYLANRLDIDKKLTENIKSIMHQYFRTKNSKYIETADINIHEVGEDKFISLENQYGIEFKRFGANQLYFKALQDERQEQREQEENQKIAITKLVNQQELTIKNLEFQKAIASIKRELELFYAETDNKKRAEMLKSLKEIFDNLPPEQAELILETFKIETYGKNGEHINIFDGIKGRSK